MNNAKTKQPHKTTRKLLKWEQQLATMPELSHYPDRTEPFDIIQSPLVNWICDNPVFRNWLFDRIRHSKLITFNPKTQTWKPNTNPVDSATPIE